jgi:beta-phosphoglucomutase
MDYHIKALILNMDGVIVDTSEYHFRAWKRLADEIGIPFTRADNERLRGASCRESLLRLLQSKPVSEAQIQDMMARQTSYYQEALTHLTPDDLLPGVADLLDQLDAASIPYAIASTDHDARMTLERLGILSRLAALANGTSVDHPRPTLDLFRCAAAQLSQEPHKCLVADGTEEGIEAALQAGMPSLALGPANRFADLQKRNGPITRWDSLQEVKLAELLAIGQPDRTWTVTWTKFEPQRQHHMETVFTIGNGYFCSRGSLEEGHPNEHALTLAHGIFDDMPISFTELASLPNWLDLSLSVDGERFGLDRGRVLDFRQYLNLQQGILHREVRWESARGVVLDLSFERFASYVREHVGALRVLITAVNRSCHLEVALGINGHVANGDLLHWHHVDQGETANGTVWLRSRTRRSGIELATAAAVTSPAETPPTCQQCPGQPCVVFRQDLGATQTLQLDKLVSYTASRDPVANASDVMGRALAALEGQTYDQLRAAQVMAWAALWDACDVLIEGDPEAQLAIRFHLFQLLIAAPRHDDRVSIGAKTLSGLGYHGHVFWDTEIFILPFFIYTQPELARNMLLYRYHTLPGARRKAAGNGFSGAQYAWESADTGDEVTPRWVPDFEGKELVRIWTGDIEIHISADIAYAVHQYWQVTGDDEFLRDYGAEIILDTARFWGDRAELEEKGGQRHYVLRDVIGPDEYHDHVDNNAYTNRMMQWHLQLALSTLNWLDSHHPAKARILRRQLDLTPERLAHWQDVIDHVVLNYDPQTGLMVQFDGFFERAPIAPETIASTKKSMQVVLGIEGANASQVIKQADVLMLLCLLRDEYDAKTWRKNWDTYMPLTDHQYGSSLGPSFHAWAACEMNCPDEAYQHFMLAAQADLRDVRGNAGDGIHAASAGGLWQAIAFGFAGLRLSNEGPVLNPRLPSHWTRLAFSYSYHGEKRHVDIRREGGGSTEV